MKVVVNNRQRGVAVDLDVVAPLAQKAGDACLLCPPGSAWAELSVVAVTLVSDPRIAALHREFLGLSEPTDVLTFAHGEIVISAATAAREAWAHSEPLEREISRYIIHGLLHLRGYDDASPADRQVMWQLQESIVEQLWLPVLGAAATNVHKRIPGR